MIFLPVPGKANYTQAKAYCSVIHLSLKQKKMQKLVDKDIGDKTQGHVHYIFNNLPTTQGRPQKLQYTL
jgi:hypothetical protein